MKGCSAGIISCREEVVKSLGETSLHESPSFNQGLVELGPSEALAGIKPRMRRRCRRFRCCRRNWRRRALCFRRGN